MRKSWLAAAAIALMLATIGYTAEVGGQEPSGKPSSMVVASAEEAHVVIQDRVPIGPRHDMSPSVTGTLPLLLVGSLLLGLAAAVRRTT